jgi:molybdenum cofactor cytidylyltransferase
MGKNKLLLKLRGKPLIELVLDALEASKVDEIIVVLGHKPWEIEDAIRYKFNLVRTVVNENYVMGMSSSFKTGIKNVGRVDAAFLVLGDQLIFDSEFLDAMIERMEENRGRARIVSPVFEGRKGHPVLFSKELFAEILRLDNNESIRDIIHRHGDSLLTIRGDKWTVMDIDTTEDFMEATRFYERDLNRE